MQIIFIHHSCFLVELDDKVLIFDYFDGDKVEGMHFTGKLPSYEPDTKIYMFASHSHKDHYDMDILRLTDKYSNIHYVFSKDIRISPHFLSKHGIDPAVRDRVTFVSPDNTYHVDDLDIIAGQRAAAQRLQQLKAPAPTRGAPLRLPGRSAAWRLRKG